MFIINHLLQKRPENLYKFVNHPYTLFISGNCALRGHYAGNGSTFLPTFRDNLSVLVGSWSMKMVPICRPETSVRNNRYSPRNNPEERSSHLLRGGSLNSRIVYIYVFNLQAPCILYIGQAYRYSPEYAFYIFSQQIYYLIIFFQTFTIFVYPSTKCRVFPNVTPLGS